MLTDESLEFARSHITKFYDTDFFPKPFEYRALWYFWDEVKSYLLKAQLNDLFSGPPRALPWPKARGGYRVVHQLEPLDAISYIAMVHEVAQNIAEQRMDEDIACSYRIEIDDASFFAEGSGFSRYRAQCEALSAKHAFVLSTDISDFYNQVYLHRVGNAIESTAARKDAGQEIEKFLTRLNNKASQGLPVGPAPSVVLAEAVMIDVDQHIRNLGFEHVRYVDDIRIFSDSESALKRCLEDLVVYLHENHRLNVVPDKTSVRKTTEFLHEELQNQYQLEKLEILNDIEVTNPYSHGFDESEAYDGYEDAQEGEKGIDGGEAMEPGEVLLDALTRVRKFGMVDLAVIRAIIRRARANRLEDIGSLILSEMGFFAPAINDIALYFDALSDAQLGSLLPEFERACGDGEFDSRGVKVWMEWLFSRRAVLLRSFAIHRFVYNEGSSIARAHAAVNFGNIAWAKTAKAEILANAAWERRARIYALSVLAPDERKHFMPTISNHPSLTLTDKWVFRWVKEGCPEPKGPFDDWDITDDIPF